MGTESLLCSPAIKTPTPSDLFEPSVNYFIIQSLSSRLRVKLHHSNLLPRVTLNFFFILYRRFTGFNLITYFQKNYVFQLLLLYFSAKSMLEKMGTYT